LRRDEQTLRGLRRRSRREEHWETKKAEQKKEKQKQRKPTETRTIVATVFGISRTR
jgi:hypothetical protein